MSRYMLSECCDAYVYIPVEVTAHIYVGGDGRATKSIADTVKDIRRQALGSEIDVAEAYCSSCGGPVAAGGAS